MTGAVQQTGGRQSLWQRLRRDQRGQFAFLSIIGVIPLLFAAFSIVNSGSAIQDATRTQDAADMVALVHAAEGARSMNTLAMNHVSLTQNFATAVNSAALEAAINIHTAVLAGAIAEAAIYGHLTCKKYLKIPKIGAAIYAVCIAPSVQYGVELGIEVARVNAIRFEYRPSRSLRTANNALRALDAQNREVFDRFPEAVSEQAAQIAIEHRVEDLYFDESCARGLAESCDSGDRRQGMELPVTINEPLAAHTNFCAGLFLGTGGVPTGGLGDVLSFVPGLSSFSGALVNGSFERRQFPINQGPMYGGGDSDNYLPVHVSRESGIGQALEDYQDMAHETRLYDGFLNMHALGMNVTGFVTDLAVNAFWGRSNDGLVADASNAVRDIAQALIIGGTSTADYNKGPGFAYPTDQTVESNIFRAMVEGRTASQCVGGGGLGIVASAVGGLAGVIGGIVMPSIHDFDVYHPMGAGIVPTIAPGIDDFPDEYKPLAFIYREGNDRWSPVAFTDPNPGFVRYSQALIYNPDEISIYSQNWRARIIPATRMLELNQIISRMQSGAPDAFDEFRSDLQHAQGASGWNRLVTR